jgi:hypothetical protein
MCLAPEDLIPISTLNLALQPLIPCSTLDLTDVAPEAVVSPLILLDLNDSMLAVACVQLPYQLRY